MRGEPEKATFAEGGLMPSIVISFVTRDCRKSGKLFCRINEKNNKEITISNCVCIQADERRSLPLENQLDTVADWH